MPNFLDIPLEIRLSIYEILLVTAEPISILNFAESRDRLMPHQSLGLSPRIIETCRQVRDEAHAILYGYNTFRKEIHMHLHQALRTVEVGRALAQRGFSPDTELFEPEVMNHTVRPFYTLSSRRYIARLEIHLCQIIPDRPHWETTEVRLSHAIHDVCQHFVENGDLKLLIVSSNGCATKDHWLKAAGNDLELAGNMESLMWLYHEWHLERALLASSRQQGFMWLNSDEQHDRFSLIQGSVFFHSIRATTDEKPWRTRMSRSLPSYFARVGQLHSHARSRTEAGD